MIRSHMTPRQVAAEARKEVGQVLRHAVAEHQDLVESCPPKCDKRIISLTDRCMTDGGLEWIYALTATQGRTTVYPLLTWVTTKGTAAMQVDAIGPAFYFQEHVMDRYIQRYIGKGDLYHALKLFHSSNHIKACQPYTYKGDRENYVAVIDDGYVAGEWCPKGALVHFRTFYDKISGEKRFGHLRPACEWQHQMLNVDFEHSGRRNTPHHAWGRGYQLWPVLRRLAA
jgi:hypothetical protein